MKRLNYYIIALSLLCQSCVGQTSPKKEIYNADFKWTITIPENFDTVSAAQWAKIQNRGLEAVEKTYDQKIDNQAKTIFVFKSDQFNYFESNYQPFDTAIDGNYLASCKTVNEMMYQTFNTQMPGIRIDTAAFSETIDNLKFQVLKMKVTYPNKMVLNVFMFSRLFDKKEFSVNIMYVDTKKGELMIDAWKRSKFGQGKN
jgi:hypothetical protein